MKISKKTAISLLCLGIVLGVIGGYSATPTSTMWITGGLYPHGVSFTTFREGSNYFAKDGYGQLQSSTNATSLFLSIISDNVNIFVSQATYEFDSQLLIDEDFVSIECEDGTAFNFTGSFSPCIVVDGNNYFNLKGLNTVVYNDGGATDRVMIQVIGANSGYYEGVYVHGVNATGVVGLELYAPNGEGNTFNSFVNMKLWRCDTSILFNYSGSGWNNRNFFYNVVTNLGTSFGVHMIGLACSGNVFFASNFAHHDIGLNFDSSSSGGNSFIGCTWDTNDIYAINMTPSHRSLKIVDATVWHVIEADAFNGGNNWGDRFVGVSGNAYSSFVGQATIGAGNTTVILSYDAWEDPWDINIMPTTTLGTASLYVSQKNSSQATISLSSTLGTNVNFNYRVSVFP